MTAARDFRRVAVVSLTMMMFLLVGSSAVALGAPLLTLENPAQGAVTNQATPSFAGTSEDILDPVILTLYEGPSASGSPLQTSLGVLPTLQAQWQTTLAETLSSGQYTAIATQLDTSSGEPLESSAVTFTVDTLAPAVSLGSVPALSNDATPSFSGSAGSAAGDGTGVTLRVYEGSSVGGPIAEETTVSRSGSSWTHTAGTLADGTYTAQAFQGDSAGNLGESSAVTFTIDTQAPSVSLDTVPTLTSDSTPTFTGGAGTLAGDHTSVTVVIRHEGSIVSGSNSVGISSGKWSFTSSSLPDGSYTVGVLQEDAAGNIATVGPVAFTIDTHAPAVSIEGLSSPSNDPTPTLSGGAGSLVDDSPVVTVIVHKGSLAGELVESTEVARVGSVWSHTTGPLPDGTYTAQAVQEDKAGVKGESSTTSFTIDTHAPVVSIDEPVSPTKDPTPTLSGKAGALPGDHATVAVVIREGATIVSEAKSVSVSGEKWSYTPPTLADGNYTVEAFQSDAAGNIGSAVPVSLTVDTHVPAVSIEAPASPTNNRTPSLSGNAGTLPGDHASVTVVVRQGSTIVNEVTAVSVSGGKWSYTPPPLSDGTYTARALQEDDAGARGESGPVTFVVDTQAPVVSIESPKIKDSTASFTGHAGALAGDIASVVVVISEGGSVVNEAKASVSHGAWSYTAPSLSDGVYAVQVSQHDSAGNIGLTSPVAFVIDTNAPKPSINPPAASINSSTPTFTGTAGARSLDEKSVSVAVYRGTTVVGEPLAESSKVPVEGTGWSYTAPPLASGTYTLLVKQHDTAKGSGSSALVFIIDTTAPHVTLAQPENNAVLTTSQPTFSGLAGTEVGDHAAVTLKIYTGTTATAAAVQTLVLAANNGEWSSGSSVASLPNGIYTAIAEQVDDAGNHGTSRSTFAIGVPAPSVVTPTAPSASFRWFPVTPRVGEVVSLVSTSTAGSSPLTAYAWSLNGASTFMSGPAVQTTTFSNPGPHFVQLQVTGGDGLNAVTGQTITVARAVAVLMQPFPVVRIAGSGNANSIRISLFTVLAPTGAKVTVSCRGRGCPAKTQSIVARALRSKHRAATVLISFGRFERSLGVGAVLEIKVSRKGQIGKYTRFTVRRGKLPARLDTCLSSDGTKPMSCPS